MSIELKVPAAGESINEVEIGDWLRKEGEFIEKDKPVVVLETEKATMELPAPESGFIEKILKSKGQTATIGEVICHIRPSAPPAAITPAAAVAAQTGPTPAAPQAAAPASKKESAPAAAPLVMPAAQRVLAEKNISASEVQATGLGGRILKEDVMRKAEAPASAPAAPASSQKVTPSASSGMTGSSGRREESVRMSRLRRTVAQRLVEAQHNAALLTTFNEINMSAVMALRKEYGEAFKERYKTKLGFSSFFVRAVVDALKLIPQINAEIRGDEIVYHHYYDIGVAIGAGKGLVVPVLRNAEWMSFADIEKAIGDFAARAQENKLKIEELQGGTFTITNGGVYGSLLSTPIVNPPQSGVLGMHSIQERPVAENGVVVIRPMMYVALTYDHRVVDGREAVTFLKRVKEAIENPARMLMEV